MRKSSKFLFSYKYHQNTYIFRGNYPKSYRIKCGLDKLKKIDNLLTTDPRYRANNPKTHREKRKITRRLHDTYNKF